MSFMVEDLQNGQPSAIDFETEGYDGPAPGDNVMPLFRQPIAEVPAPVMMPAPRPAPRVNREYIALVNAAMDVLAARLLGLIAVIGAVAMFGFAVFDPVPWRTYTVVSYSVVVLLPIVWLYLRKG